MMPVLSRPFSFRRSLIFISRRVRSFVGSPPSASLSTFDIRLSTARLLWPLVFLFLGALWINPLPAAETNISLYPMPTSDLFRNPPSLAVSTNSMGIDSTNVSRFPILAIQSMDVLDDRQKLGIGDKLIYRVIEDQDEPQSITITDSGDIYVPYYGGLVPAVDKTCKQMAKEIKGLLEKDLYKRATVIIGLETLNKTITGRKVYISGHVRLPGPQDIPAGEPYTVSKAVLRAGGFSDFAKGSKVKVTRSNGANGTKIFTIDVNEILEKGKTGKDLVLEPGDLIIVPSRTFNF